MGRRRVPQPLRQGGRRVEDPRAAPLSAVQSRLRPRLGQGPSRLARRCAPMPAFLGAASGDQARRVDAGGAALRGRDRAPSGARSRRGDRPALTLDQARTALRRSLAYDAIENVSSAYGDYLDDFQSDNFSALLATDGFKMSAFAGYYVGRDRVAEAGRRVWGPAPETRAGISFHWRVQPVILVSDDGRSANQRVRLFQPRTGKEVGGPGRVLRRLLLLGHVPRPVRARGRRLADVEPLARRALHGHRRLEERLAARQGPDDAAAGPDQRARARGQRLQARRAGHRARPPPGALPRRHRRGVAMADDPADVVRVPQPGQRPGARVLPGGLPAVHGAARPAARPPRLPAAAGLAAAARGLRQTSRSTARGSTACCSRWSTAAASPAPKCSSGRTGARRTTAPPACAGSSAPRRSPATPGADVLDDQAGHRRRADAAVGAGQVRPRRPARALPAAVRRRAGLRRGASPTSCARRAARSPSATCCATPRASPTATPATRPIRCGTSSSRSRPTTRWRSSPTCCRKVPLLYDPGTHWHYSAGVDVQARLVEVFSGQPFDEYVRDHIFRPLGMTPLVLEVRRRVPRRPRLDLRHGPRRQAPADARQGMARATSPTSR